MQRVPCSVINGFNNLPDTHRVPKTALCQAELPSEQRASAHSLGAVGQMIHQGWLGEILTGAPGPDRQAYAKS